MQRRAGPTTSATTRGDRVGAAYGANDGRPAAIKATYDPESVFRANQDVAPAPA